MSEKVMDETYVAENQLCPLRFTVDVIGGKWKLPIICMLANGLPTRYSSIKRKLTGITNMMLSQSLKELEASGIIHREQYNEIPPRVEYTLTDKGKSIIPPLIKLAEWGAEHMQEGKTCAVFCDTCQSIK
ncbi:MAG TPA: helix-turn-helix domain-containing protein [Methylomusa anaerophila]|uniref:Putative HTH-type transcriptional regulator YybR n=1 Tax=Methylomusa anaerophila TaxID=1930071 RepID=A0A348AIK8_9FIRM|nr:helix-turn-helix domain-containing protein [Methylomusa anaerophila]BBB90906.1 putative HTH-type transcriptional regulator YybR [Methylomusa anaerophila]HML90688.1 helix-turn-helix domain-containing protein [Methylomusa anaerophila]